ncbi:HORMA domain-containing protein 1 isoform X2 [Pseudophryne corroboree]|uniref:HORMA domain-containing protein 1 isoform X2 n=1 Tax=Pseudophryne corroboree TaxID=495146 RepID=UPI003081EB07
MATAQMHRSSASAVMIPNTVATEQQSLVLVKRLLAISVSCVTYLRGLFPEYAYGTRYLEDLCVKILREDESCPGSTQMVKWMLGCYDAIQKKYIFLNIEDSETVTEYYQFKFKYSPSGPVMEISSNEGHSITACSDVKKASVMLVRKLYVLMQNLGPLPNDVCLTMKLFYYDEVTPKDYQPPGFKEGTCDSMMFEGDPMNLNVGEVSTPFHVLKVRVTTDKDRMEKMEKHLLKKKGHTQAICLNMEEDQVMESSTETMQVNPSAAISGRQTRSVRVISDMTETMQVNPSPAISGRQTRNVRVISDMTETMQVNPSAAISGRQTRSVRVISDMNSAAVTGKTQPRSSKRTKKQQPGTQSQALDLPDSQDEPIVVKRRKMSEPKDPL